LLTGASVPAELLSAVCHTLASDLTWKTRPKFDPQLHDSHTKNTPLPLCLITLRQTSLVVGAAHREPRSSSPARVEQKLSLGWNVAFGDGAGGPHRSVCCWVWTFQLRKLWGAFTRPQHLACECPGFLVGGAQKKPWGEYSHSGKSARALCFQSGGEVICGSQGKSYPSCRRLGRLFVQL